MFHRAFGTNSGWVAVAVAVSSPLVPRIAPGSKVPRPRRRGRPRPWDGEIEPVKGKEDLLESQSCNSCLVDT